jgi:hypothetical protein
MKVKIFSLVAVAVALALLSSVVVSEMSTNSQVYGYKGGNKGCVDEGPGYHHSDGKCIKTFGQNPE